MQASPGISGRHYLAIFVLACTTLSYQILITRFFSVMLYYHFAFAAISLAMLGLTRGAMEVYSKPSRYTPERVGVEFARHASLFAITGVGAMIAFLCVPLVVPGDDVLVALAIVTLAFVSPFTESGVCITLLLTRLPYGGGWLYAADLAGAALGCLGVIFLLLVIDPVSATLGIGALAAGAGFAVVRGSGDRGSLRLSGAVSIVLAAAGIVHAGLDVSGKTHLGVFWAKGAEQTGTLFERWNTYSRVRVTALGETTPFGWGFSRKPQVKIEQDRLDIDADAATVITRHDGDMSKLSYLKDDVINAAYLVQPPAEVAVVGVGGGRDILSGAAVRRQTHPRHRDQSRDLRRSHRQVRRFLRPSRSGARRVPGQRRSPQLHQSLLRPLRPGPDLADRYLGRNSRRRTDADGKPIVYRGGMGRLLPGAEARRAIVGLALVRSGQPPRRILSPGGDRCGRVAAPGRARGRPRQSRHRTQRRQHHHGDHPSRRLHRMRNGRAPARDWRRAASRYCWVRT